MLQPDGPGHEEADYMSARQWVYGEVALVSYGGNR